MGLIHRRPPALLIVVLALLLASQTFAIVPPERDHGLAKSLGEKQLRHPDLYVGNVYQSISQLPSGAAAEAQQELSALRAPADTARLDIRTGRWGTLLPGADLLPGPGNDLTWPGGEPPRGRDGWRAAAWEAFFAYLSRNRASLGIDPGELQNPGHVTVHRDGGMIQIVVPRRVGGIPVRDSSISAVINQGTLTLLGAQNWNDVSVSTASAVTAAAATQNLLAHLDPLSPDSYRTKAHLELVPMAVGTDLSQVAVGEGLTYRLTWVLSPHFEGEIGEWEGLVDAHSGELIAFEDKANYAEAEGAGSTREVKGGVFPLSNDGVGMDGTEQAGWPMPYTNVDNGGDTFTTDGGGNIAACLDGTISTALTGPYIEITDTCGPVSESTAGGVLDLGTLAAPSIDCDVAGGASLGNTHASRSGFYEINKIAEMGRSHLPDNLWVRSPLPVLMNIALNCNATGGAGQLRFYQSGGPCTNTGEIAGVFDHEWGHGMDASDANPGISNPGEGIADVYASLRLNTSCIGRNFRLGVNCGGYGDPCTQCDGVRDIDWANRFSGNPHDIAFIDAACGGGPAPCGGSVHCEGAVYAESVWDLWNRDLQNPPYNMSLDTAREVATFLTFQGGQAVGTWYNCVNGTGTGDGCNANGGYLNYLAADDDDNDLSNGTPHMTAIFNAFDRHGIACPTPTVQDSGCAGTPTTAPATVTADPLDRAVDLSWTAVAGATSYRVFRAEGVEACNYGKTLVAETTDLAFLDTGLQNGRLYSYQVVPMGPGASCFGPASTCTNVTPTPGANLFASFGANPLQVPIGDGDPFVDNCERANVSFSVSNLGTGALTNLRIDSITSPDKPAVDPSITFVPILSASLSECGSAASGFDFIGSTLDVGGSISFDVCLTSDELSPLVRCFTVTINDTESDIQSFANLTFSFDADLDGWSLESGTFNHVGAGGNPGGHLQSSAFQDNACDRVRSPLMALSGTSTLSVSTNFDIEPFSAGTWYDRANVAVIEGDGTRTVIAPDGGRPYNAGPGGPGSYSGCNDPDVGWAALNNTWADSTWSAGFASGFSGLVQLQVTSATDGALANQGFWFDTVTVTDVGLQVADTQSDVCVPLQSIFTDGFESGDTSLWTLDNP